MGGQGRRHGPGCAPAGFPVLAQGRLSVSGGSDMCRVPRTGMGMFAGIQMCQGQLGKCVYGVKY